MQTDNQQVGGEQQNDRAVLSEERKVHMSKLVLCAKFPPSSVSKKKPRKTIILVCLRLDFSESNDKWKGCHLED